METGPRNLYCRPGVVCCARIGKPIHSRNTTAGSEMGSDRSAVRDSIDSNADWFVRNCSGRKGLWTTVIW